MDSIGSAAGSARVVKSRPSLRSWPQAVHAYVLDTVHNDQVLNSIVRSDPVQMVNVFGAEKLSSKVSLYHKAMLKCSLRCNVAIGFQMSAALP